MEQAFRDAVGAKVARDLFAAVPKPSARLVVTLGRRGTGYEGAAGSRRRWRRDLVDGVSRPTHPPAATCASLIPALAFGVSLEVASKRLTEQGVAFEAVAPR